jgi:hypothetical protein
MNDAGRAAGNSINPRRDSFSNATRQCMSFSCPSTPRQFSHSHTSRDSPLRVNVKSPTTRERMRSMMSSEKTDPVANMAKA